MTFSLRTLLLVLTALGLWLGWMADRSRRQSRAIAGIERLGGRIWYDFQYSNGRLDTKREPGLPEWLWPIFGKGRVEYVDFTFAPVQDKDLEELPRLLADLPKFRGLSFDRSRVGDATVQRLAGLVNFQALNLDGTRVTDLAIPAILAMEDVEAVSLVFADGISAAGLAQLQAHPRLSDISWNTHRPNAVADWDIYNRLLEHLYVRAGKPFPPTMSDALP
ncbi:MAG: hypothetical protein U0836_27860 [Pirellulales bacterium]